MYIFIFMKKWTEWIVFKQVCYGGLFSWILLCSFYLLD